MATSCDAALNSFAHDIVVFSDDLSESTRIYESVYKAQGQNNLPSVLVVSGGDLLLYSRDDSKIYRERAGFIATGPLIGPKAPRPEILRVVRRPSTTIQDIDFIIKDEDSATVAVGAFALENGNFSLTSLRRMTTFLEGTASNLGPTVTSGNVHRLTWDAAAEFLGTTSSFLNLQFQIQAKDARDLMELDLLTIPAGIPNVEDPQLVISRSPFADSDFLEVWLWLVATADPDVTLGASGSVFGTSGIYNGVLLAQGTSTTAQGRQFLLGRMGVLGATSERSIVRVLPRLPVPWFNLNPGTRIGTRPVKVNQISFDTGATSGFSVVVP